MDAAGWNPQGAPPCGACGAPCHQLLRWHALTEPAGGAWRLAPTLVPAMLPQAVCGRLQVYAASPSVSDSAHRANARHGKRIDTSLIVAARSRD